MRLIEDQLWLHKDGDPNEGNYKPGWYFQNEVEGLEGPYDTMLEAIEARVHYAESL